MWAIKKSQNLLIIECKVGHTHNLTTRPFNNGKLTMRDRTPDDTLLRHSESCSPSIHELHPNVHDGDKQRGGSGLSRLLSDVVTALETSLLHVPLVLSTPARFLAFSAPLVRAALHARTHTHRSPTRSWTRPASDRFLPGSKHTLVDRRQRYTDLRRVSWTPAPVFLAHPRDSASTHIKRRNSVRGLGAREFTSRVSAAGFLNYSEVSEIRGKPPFLW